MLNLNNLDVTGMDRRELRYEEEARPFVRAKISCQGRRVVLTDLAGVATLAYPQNSEV